MKIILNVFPEPGTGPAFEYQWKKDALVSWLLQTGQSFGIKKVRLEVTGQ